MSAGKGDKPRPVNKSKWDANYEDIHWPSRAKPHPKPDGNTKPVQVPQAMGK
jgi:hypothetical protein